MKVHATKLQVNGVYNSLAVGYCDLYYLLYNHSASYYNAGIYGWNWDAYIIGNRAIVTGYRNLVGKPVKHSLVKEYNDRAKAVVDDRSLSYELQREKIESLLQEFLDKAFAA